MTNTVTLRDGTEIHKIYFDQIMNAVHRIRDRDFPAFYALVCKCLECGQKNLNRPPVLDLNNFNSLKFPLVDLSGNIYPWTKQVVTNAFSITFTEVNPLKNALEIFYIDPPYMHPFAKL